MVEVNVASVGSERFYFWAVAILVGKDYQRSR